MNNQFCYNIKETGNLFICHLIPNAKQDTFHSRTLRSYCPIDNIALWIFLDMVYRPYKSLESWDINFRWNKKNDQRYRKQKPLSTRRRQNNSINNRHLQMLYMDSNLSIHLTSGIGLHNSCIHRVRSRL